MPSIASQSGRKRRRQGKRELTDLNWGDGYRKIQYEPEDEDGWDEDWEDDWEGSNDDWEDWSRAPAVWEEDELD